MGHMDPFETWSLAPLIVHHHIIWPSYPFTASHCFSSIYHSLALPCHWSQFISIYYIHSFISRSIYFFQYIQSNSFHLSSIQSIFNSSNPFTSNQFQFYSNHYSSYQHHSSNLIHVHSSIRHKLKNQKIYQLCNQS
jgi:hypothetical protein